MTTQSTEVQQAELALQGFLEFMYDSNYVPVYMEDALPVSEMFKEHFGLPIMPDGTLSIIIPRYKKYRAERLKSEVVNPFAALMNK